MIVQLIPYPSSTSSGTPEQIPVPGPDGIVLFSAEGSGGEERPLPNGASYQEQP